MKLKNENGRWNGNRSTGYGSEWWNGNRSTGDGNEWWNGNRSTGDGNVAIEDWNRLDFTPQLWGLEQMAFFLRFTSSHYEAKQALHALKLRAEYELFPASLQVRQPQPLIPLSTILNRVCFLTTGGAVTEEDS